ncbi:MAG: HDOD domain-containing protein [Oceanospirillaceae bacterium]|nr:HDOD domain-containing protein [Oceanospirillaceae bacterium]
MEIQELLNQTDKLPNIPEVVRELIKALNNPNANYSDISQKVAQDQTISLKVLRIVNSAYFGLSRKVASIDEAVVMLGMSKLKTLVIASGFANCASNVEGIDLPAFWSDSFQVAELARWLAEMTEDEVEPDLAFTAGIIHNIGQLLLHMAQPNRAMAIKTIVDTTDVCRSDAEMERLGFTTADAGEALVSSWKFPEQLALAIKYQHNPTDLTEDPKLSAILFLASTINREAKSGDDFEDILERYPAEIATLAGIKTSLADYLPEALELKSGLDSLAA